MYSSFEWHHQRNISNKAKHGVDFETAQYAFFDPHRLIVHDAQHSEVEERWFCIGKVEERILTVRFTYRHQVIRIFGAAEWRKWRKFYEQYHAGSR
ncbi:BrnT family toxin [Picosynechococcus sp. PCC 7117]|uniref:BrnT family toxin n=1 Tax=Picosynechococcus sp. PCC 7117 TaxID=195498 RepID=UPI000903A628|nr:BrnT family toxin [Picosynechococcus sp. PCC 7117]